LKICPRLSPDIADCLKQAIEATKPFLESGNFGDGLQIEAFDSIPIGNILTDKGVDIFNMQAKGITNFRIEKVRFNPDKFKVIEFNF